MNDREIREYVAGMAPATLEQWRRQHHADFVEIERLMTLQKKLEAKNAELVFENERLRARLEGPEK